MNKGRGGRNEKGKGREERAREAVGGMNKGGRGRNEQRTGREE